MGCCSSTGKHNVNRTIKETPGPGQTKKKPDSIARPIGQQLNPQKQGEMQQIKDNPRIDTPQMTQENVSPDKKEDDPNQLKVIIGQDPNPINGKPKSYQYFDISPKVIKKHKIYHISSTFPVQKPYSNHNDWQNVIQKSPSLTEEEMVGKILQIRNRNWIQEQIKLQNEFNSQSPTSFEYMTINKKVICLKEQFNWFIWALSQYYFQQKLDNKFQLPKNNAKRWMEGFEFKGVYIKVMPYEDAYYIQNEIQAQKYVWMELMELNALSVSLNQQYEIKDNLHKDVILPLIAGVSFGGFYLYGTPIIYTQELDQTKEFYKDTMNGSKVFALHNSVQNSIQMQAINNQSNNSFSYLHNNISPDFIQKSYFKFMPILKNISTKNMIPMIDFEEYNEKQNDDANIDLRYILVHLFDVLPRLSETASTMMMRFPCFINEDISFHQFPKNNYMESRELKRMLVSESENDFNDDDDDYLQKDPTDVFSKKFFSKHGWDFILMYKKGVTNENKRATNFYIQREIPLHKAKQQESNNVNKNNNNMLFIDDYAPNGDNNIDQQQRNYVSPHKQTILKRSESISEENKIFGNVLVAAYNYKKDFKLKYSMNNHNFSTNIESLYSASVEQVVRIIEASDNIYNSQALKELFHRKGLNLRFQWVVLAKLRVNQQRELVMIDILLRVMRRIIHEEVKLKSKVQMTQVIEGGGSTIVDEYFQGNQTDNFKDILTFYVTTILKRKISKNKQVFEETLLGLFLSRMSIFGLVHSLNLKKEEFFYLESKDILEDIIEAPSKNPTMFINAIQTYFKIEFKPELLRAVRQDKLAFLSRNNSISKTDIKSLLLKVNTYYSIREEAYFILAKQITNTARNNASKKPGKIKTKADKDILKKSFQKPKPNETNMPSARSQITDARMHSNASIIEHSDSQTKRNHHPMNNLGQGNQGTHRQYANMDKAIIDDSIEFSSPPINQHKLSKLSENKRSDIPIDFSKLSKRNSFKPSSISEIILPSILYKLKTFLSNNPMYYFDDQSKIYVGETFSVFKSYYETPSVDCVDSWVMVMESLLQNVITVNGHEQVLIEAYVYYAILIYFFKNDPDEMFKVLQKIRDGLFNISYCCPETLILTQILTAMLFEDKSEGSLIEAEKNYLTSMICILQLYGDPRGRGNITMPYSLYISWKLGLLSMAEDKKIIDSEFAEEIFDASLKCLINHKKNFREQQMQTLAQELKKGTKEDQVYTKTKFEIEQEKLELQMSLFDIRKYRNKPFNITFASGLPKSNTYLQKKQNHYAMHVYVSQGHSFNKGSNNTASNNISSKPEERKKEEKKKSQFLTVDNDHSPNGFKSKSHIPKLKQKTAKVVNEYDLDPSEIDLDIEDENKNFFVDENFKNNEWIVGSCPFYHWSAYRQEINILMQTVPNSYMKDKDKKISITHKELYKNMIQTYLPKKKDQFYQWLIKFNPIMYQSGIQWSNFTIKEIIFSQNQQMMSSSSSSMLFTHNNLSSQSMKSIPSSAKERRPQRLGNYSQILSKDVGGISKQDMNGALFTMGTDCYGQLGQDIISLQENQNINLKILYPRMIIPLKDEIIKEICCGHGHTLIINANGQVYGWGLNESGQLGLGADAPLMVRKPILNRFLQNVAKLSAGNEHSLAINRDGELYIWGGGGLTGLGDLQIHRVPQKMEFFNKTKVLQAVCGGLHTLVVNREGEIYSWGSTEGGQLGLPQQLIMQLCEGKEQPVLTPQKIPKLEGQQIVQIACGEAHSIAMNKDRIIYGWGMSNYGQLGLGFSSETFEPGIGMEKSKVHEPQEITALKNERITRIICGSTFSLFQSEKGDLYGCGMNDLGQIGIDTFMEEIATLERAKRGKHHQNTSDITIPTKVVCFQGIALHNIACGENHALAVSGDEKNILWSWGMFKQGQLGLGEVQNKINPRPVQSLCSSFINRIACGSQHSLVLIGDTTQITTYFANSETISNNWHCDIRGLGSKEKSLEDFMGGYEEEVPEDTEGKIKNPK